MSQNLNKFVLRKATIKDIKSIHRLLGYYAEKGLLLPRSLSELYDHLRDFYIIDNNEPDPAIIAVGSLGICWEDLAEIRSLAVAEDHQGRKIGTDIAEACINDARSLGLHKVFALTYVPQFFSSLGFKEVEKSILPHKIWSDCLKCPKFPDCDETAMMLEW